MTALLVVAGPTASGKTGLALEVAEILGAEIISADSRQVYRGLDIGTAKPSGDERARVPHHLLDRVEPERKYSAGLFAREAAGIACSLALRGLVPLVCGGTGFYIRALLEPMFEEPEIDPESLRSLRQEHRERARIEGPSALHGELERVDPVSAARLHPNDFQRVSRALELYNLTGRRMSELHAERPGVRGTFSACEVVLDPPAEILRERIVARTDRMIGEGWLDEVRALLDRGVSPCSPGFQSLGYREMAAAAIGQISLERARDEIVRLTWQYARRQRTWFRRLKYALRLECAEGEAQKVVRHWRDFIEVRKGC